MTIPYAIGIAGGSASGKSTFCGLLEKALCGYRLTTFHMDHYFKPEQLRPHVKAPIADQVYMDDNHPETIDLPRLRDDLSDIIKKNQTDIVIVEGLLTLADDEICRMLDLKLFIDCRADERIVRRLKRNMEWGLTFDQIANVYLDMVRYRHDEYVEPSKWKADLILNGSAPSETALKIIAEAVNAAVS